MQSQFPHLGRMDQFVMLKPLTLWMGSVAVATRIMSLDQKHLFSCSYNSQTRTYTDTHADADSG